MLAVRTAQPGTQAAKRGRALRDSEGCALRERRAFCVLVGGTQAQPERSRLPPPHNPYPGAPYCKSLKSQPRGQGGQPGTRAEPTETRRTQTPKSNAASANSNMIKHHADMRSRAYSPPAASS